MGKKQINILPLSILMVAITGYNLEKFPYKWQILIALLFILTCLIGIIVTLKTSRNMGNIVGLTFVIILTAFGGVYQIAKNRFPESDFYNGAPIILIGTSFLILGAITYIKIIKKGNKEETETAFIKFLILEIIGLIGIFAGVKIALG